MIAGFLATVLKLGYTGLVAADLGLHITSLANEGAGIYREIPDRRQALVVIQDEFEGLQAQFDTELKDINTLSTTVNGSLQANNLLYVDLDGVFKSLSSLHELFKGKGLADPASTQALDYERLSKPEKNAVSYLLPAAKTGFFAFELATYLRSMSRGTTRVDQMSNHMKDIRAWNRLTPQQKTMLSAKKFGVKNPHRVSGYKLMKSALKFGAMAGLSVGSIIWMESYEKAELEELNAAIGGVQKYIQVLKGEILPDPSDFADEIPPGENDYLYSLPRLKEHKTALIEFDAYDFENFMTVVNFFRDIYQGADREALRNWREQISLGQSDSDGDSLFESLYSLVYSPFTMKGFTDLKCMTRNDWTLNFDADGNELFYPYQSGDMRCVQGSLHNFFTEVGVNVLRLAIDIAPTVPSGPELTDKKRQDIISVCKNRVYQNLQTSAIRALIKRVKFVNDVEIDRVLQEDLNGTCPFRL